MGEPNEPHDSHADEGTPRTIPSLRDTGEAATPEQAERATKSPEHSDQAGPDASSGGKEGLPSPADPPSGAD